MIATLASVVGLRQMTPKHVIYDLYREKPPERGRGVTVQVAYWDGYDGRNRQYPRGSAAWWAQKAGKDNRRDAALGGAA